MTEKRTPGELPGWLVFILMWLPLALIAWVGSICLCWMWLSNVGLIGGGL